MDIKKFQNVVILAFEYPPFKGGIANYTKSLELWLLKKRLLNKVITITKPVPLCDYHEYPHWEPQRTNKFISFLFRSYQWLYLFRVLSKISRSNTVLIPNLFFDLSKLSIRYFVFRKIPFVPIFHGLDIYEFEESDKKYLEHLVRKSFQLISNSQFTRGLLARITTKEIWVFPPLLDTTYFSENATLTLMELENLLGLKLTGKRIVLSVCRLVERKGIQVSIPVVVELTKNYDDLIYLIVGDGPFRNNLEALVPFNRVKKIEFLGKVNDQIKFSLLKHAIVYLMPNLNIYNNPEGFGISFVEASYFKNWVIGGKSGGVTESVNTQTNGFLVDYSKGPEIQIRKYLESVLENKMDESQLEIEKNRVIQNYTIDNFQ